MEAPIGSIVAFAGEGMFTATGAIDPAFEAMGWMFCDGRLLDGNDPRFQPLFMAIRFAWGGDVDRNFFKIPDLQGYFLRGVEREQGGRRDPDGDVRGPAAPGMAPLHEGNAGRRVGSQEGFATAMPTGEGNRFTTQLNGEHSHGLDFQINAARDVNGQDNTVANPAPLGETPKFTETSPGHVHFILGGDTETRPINVYVHWIIRFQ